MAFYLRVCACFDCSERIPHNRLMCGRHWFIVPPWVRREIWRAWNPESVEQSPRYYELVVKAVNHIAEFEEVADRLEAGTTKVHRYLVIADKTVVNR